MAKTKSRAKRYPEEVRERAVRMVLEHGEQYALSDHRGSLTLELPRRLDSAKKVCRDDTESPDIPEGVMIGSMYCNGQIFCGGSAEVSIAAGTAWSAYVQSEGVEQSRSEIALEY